MRPRTIVPFVLLVLAAAAAAVAGPLQEDLTARRKRVMERLGSGMPSSGARPTPKACSI